MSLQHIFKKTNCLLGFEKTTKHTVEFTINWTWAIKVTHHLPPTFPRINLSWTDFWDYKTSPQFLPMRNVLWFGQIQVWTRIVRDSANAVSGRRPNSKYSGLGDSWWVKFADNEMKIDGKTNLHKYREFYKWQLRSIDAIQLFVGCWKTLELHDVFIRDGEFVSPQIGRGLFEVITEVISLNSRGSGHRTKLRAGDRCKMQLDGVEYSAGICIQPTIQTFGVYTRMKRQL